MLVMNEAGLRSGSGSNPKVARPGTVWMVLVFARLKGITGIISILAHGHIGRNANGHMTGIKVPMRRSDGGVKDKSFRLFSGRFGKNVRPRQDINLRGSSHEELPSA
jgi:hypothetical protein